MSRAQMVLDTGPIIAIIDEMDRHHETCEQFFLDSETELLTTEAVVAEACYVLRRVPEGSLRAMRFILRIRVEVIGPTRESLERSLALMSKYADAPMDYADASLVALGEAAGISQIFTLDRRHFLTYRLHDREPFEIVP